jgi:hypothetical protein
MWDEAKKDSGHMGDVMARVLCLRPPSPEHLKFAIRFADLAVARSENPHHLWFFVARSLASYRTGDFRASASMLEPAMARMKPANAAAAATGWAVIAMAKHGGRDRDGARSALRHAVGLRKEHRSPDRRPVASIPAYDWLYSDLLITEARALIGFDE